MCMRIPSNDLVQQYSKRSMIGRQVESDGLSQNPDIHFVTFGSHCIAVVLDVNLTKPKTEALSTFSRGDRSKFGRMNQCSDTLISRIYDFASQYMLTSMGILFV